MPFQAKSFDEVPRGGAPGEVITPVHIFFHGQLILRSSDGLGCDVIVNPLATGHVLSIEARIKEDGKGDRIAMRHFGPLNFRDSEAMLIEVTSVGDPVVPRAFKLQTTEEINFEDPNSVREDDFRWILNVEGPMFHNRELSPPGIPSQNIIRLRGGEYYFKTAARAHPRLQYRRRRGGVDMVPPVIGAIGCVASASVYLKANQSIAMTWQDDTREADRGLTLTQANGISYEIYIENTPLFLDKPREAQLARLDEFIHYYKILDVPPDERFSVIPELREGEEQLGSPDVPCQVVTQDGGH